MVRRVGCTGSMNENDVFVNDVKASVVYTSAACCLVLSNARPGVYEELKQMDEQFYKTHKIGQWRRSMKQGDVVKSSSPGYYQYKYEAV